MQIVRHIICATSALGLVSISALGQSVRTWDQPAFGTYGFGTSWIGGIAPGSQDRAVFGGTLATTFNPITVQFLTAAVAGDHVITSGHYIYTFGNPGVSLNLSGDLTGGPFGGDLIVGDKVSSFDPGLSPTARLDLEFDGELRSHGLIGGWGSLGFGSRETTVNISGVDTAVVTRVGTLIGGAIAGTGKSHSVLNISDGALLRTADIGGGNYVNGFVNVSGAGSRWDNNGQLSLGGSSSTPAQLNVTNGGYGRVGFIALIGGDENGAARVHVDGTGSLFDVTAGIWLGNGNGTGTGELRVSNGGRVVVDTDISVGRGGSAGTLIVESGGIAESGFGFIGCFPNAPGLARVTGANSRWNMTGGPIVGRESSGRLEVTNGGTVGLGGGMTIGEFANVSGELLVSGVGSRLTSSAETIIVGQRGVGSMVIEDRGLVSARNVRAATEQGSTGSIVVRTGGRLEVADLLGVGSSQSYFPAVGELSVESGGEVRAFQLTVGNPGGSGLVRVSGPGSLVDADVISVGSGVGSGTLDVSNGATVRARLAEFLIYDQGTLTGNAGIFESEVSLLWGGTISPGSSAGTMTIIGGLGIVLSTPDRAAGRIIMEIGGSTAGVGYDTINVVGYLGLGGTLELNSLNSFVPMPGQTFELFNVSGPITGQFESIIDNTGYGFIFSTAGGVGIVTATVPSPGGLAVVALGALFVSSRRR